MRTVRWISNEERVWRNRYRERRREWARNICYLLEFFHLSSHYILLHHLTQYSYTHQIPKWGRSEIVKKEKESIVGRAYNNNSFHSHCSIFIQPNLDTISLYWITASKVREGRKAVNTFCKNSKIKLIACVITFLTRGAAAFPFPPPLGAPRYDIVDGNQKFPRRMCRVVSLLE